MKTTDGIWKPFRKDLYYIAWHDKYFLGVIREFIRDIRRSCERIRKGYCDFDLFSIDWWFLKIMPAMLEDFKETTHSYPEMPGIVAHGMSVDEDDEEAKDGMAAWKEVLDRMIFLLREADKDTCTQKNPYKEKEHAAWMEFNEKYGLFGEKLLTEEERAASEAGLGTRIYTPSDVEEYKEISEKYMAEERHLKDYRTDCKNQALELFSKWFYDLWD